MADNVNVTEAGTTLIAADEVADGTLGTVKVQYVKIMDGTLGSTTKAAMASQVQPTNPGLVVRQVPCTYEIVNQNVTLGQVLGTTGAVGDYIEGVLITPALVSAGFVTLMDNETALELFIGSASGLSDLKPFYVPLGIVSASGAWKLATGNAVHCIAIGRFT